MLHQPSDLPIHTAPILIAMTGWMWVNQLLDSIDDSLDYWIRSLGFWVLMCGPPFRLVVVLFTMLYASLIMNSDHSAPILTAIADSMRIHRHFPWFLRFYRLSDSESKLYQGFWVLICDLRPLGSLFSVYDCLSIWRIDNSDEVYSCFLFIDWSSDLYYPV